MGNVRSTIFLHNYPDVTYYTDQNNYFILNDFNTLRSRVLEYTRIII